MIHQIYVEHLEFAEKISKVGTQPIIGTQINFKYSDCVGLLPLYALNEEGYKRIIKLSSTSFLENDELSDPHIDFEELLEGQHWCSYFFRNNFWIIWRII